MEIFINDQGEEYNSFIYQWFDKKMNKYYIGSHCGSTNDGYLFGGIDIKKEYRTRPDDFIREILSYHLISDNNEIRKIEKSYLLEYDVENNDRFYNRTNESYGGCHKKSIIFRLNDIDENGLNAFQRSSIKMVNTRKQKDSYKSAKVKEYITKQNIMCDIKLKISNTLSGSRWMNKNNECKYIKKEEYEHYIKDGWSDGIKHNISYSECKKIANENNIKSASDWFRFSRKNGLPVHPERKYKEWENWMIFLNKK